MTSKLPRQSGSFTSPLMPVSDGNVDTVRVLKANGVQNIARRCLVLIILSGFLLYELLVGTTTIMKQPEVKLGSVMHVTSGHKFQNKGFKNRANLRNNR